MFDLVVLAKILHCPDCSEHAFALLEVTPALCAGDSVVGHWLISSPNAEQLGFSHIDGSPDASGGSALTPHAAQIGETSPSSVSSHRSLMASVSLPLRCFAGLSKPLKRDELTPRSAPTWNSPGSGTPTCPTGTFNLCAGSAILARDIGLTGGSYCRIWSGPDSISREQRGFVAPHTGRSPRVTTVGAPDSARLLPSARLALLTCKDVADVGVGAVGWVELTASFDELSEFSLEGYEFALSLLHLGEFGFEQVGDVAAR